MTEISTWEQIYPALQSNSLFRGFSVDDIRTALGKERLGLRAYTENQMVAIEDEECSALGLVISGSIYVQRIYPTGKVVTLDTLGAGSSFGEALIFSDASRYPASITAAQESLIAYLPRQDVERLCSESPVFLENFLYMLSNRILMLNRKIKSLSYGTVRQRVANYILEAYGHHETRTLHLRQTRREMADELGLPQPSLSRELIAMRENGWIEFNRRTIHILDLQALERSLES